MIIDSSALFDECKRALMLVSQRLKFTENNDGIKLTVCTTGKGLTIRHNKNGWVIECANLSGFVRALGLICQFEKEPDGFCYQENSKFRSLGAMIDCSRNAVPSVDALKNIVISLALMGYNTLQLYTEDTFELRGYPYFGYMRGKYSLKELQDIDDFAASLGIEVIPCIQTLAHLRHAMRWDEFRDMVDCNDILLCGEEKTYEWIEAMFRTMSSAFRSRRINIGMDEAHMLGLGRYLDLHGYENRTDIMLHHLQRVIRIAEKYGYYPMMWSDMFFRLANEGKYTAVDGPVDPKVISAIPENVSLIYWDYYAEEKDTYIRMMKKHKEFGKPVIFAGGAWKWTGFTPHNQYSMKIASLAADAAEECGIQDVLITCWGDNGAEASMFSVLPSLGYWAERCWADDGEEWRKARFQICCGGNYDDLMLMDLPSYTPTNPCPGRRGLNPEKYCLYQDILLGLADFTKPEKTESQYYAVCGQKLAAAAGRNPLYFPMLHAQAKLCKLLECKVSIGTDLREAYSDGDRAVLKRILEERIPVLQKRLEDFQQAYHTQWNSENKIFGLECFDIRTGGLMQRIRTAAERIRAYLDGQLTSIPELETEILPLHDKGTDNDFSTVLWEEIVSAAGIFGI
ncbi:MAG: beta-N-acetylhexosaminidase [Lachnospiraceae bacterium]|jgi:hexosaminidase|nr:beta-N-acetylhexosaminidase [Lachnospiraceae bacterium]